MVWAGRLNQKNDGPTGAAGRRVVLLPDFPQGMGGVGALPLARGAHLTRREMAPHPGIEITRAERRISRQDPVALETVVEISRVTTCESSPVRRHGLTVISDVNISTVGGPIAKEKFLWRLAQESGIDALRGERVLLEYQ